MTRGRARLSLRRGGILGRTTIIIIDPEETLPDNLGLQTLKW